MALVGKVQDMHDDYICIYVYIYNVNKYIKVYIKKRNRMMKGADCMS